MAEKKINIRDQILYLINRGYSDTQVRTNLISKGFNPYTVDREFFWIRSRKILSYSFILLAVLTVSFVIFRNYPLVTGFSVLEQATYAPSNLHIIGLVLIAFMILFIILTAFPLIKRKYK